MKSSASRLLEIRGSVIGEIASLAAKYRAINLSMGFPDFDPPPEVIAAAHHAIDHGLNQYSMDWGLPDLRRAIAAKMKRWYDLDFDADKHVTVTCGVTEALMATFMGLINPGDEVIIIEPCHEGYLPAAVFAGAQARFVALDLPDYALDLEKLRATFSARTRAILINSPHNPTGRVFTRVELEEIARLCNEFDAIAITDEIYEHITYDDHAHIPFASLPGMMERTVTLSGFGKTYAVTGWRLGYVCAPSNFTDAIRKAHMASTVCAPTPFQAASIAALNLPDSYHQQLRSDYTVRRNMTADMLKQAGFSVLQLQGAYYALADFGKWNFDGDDYAFARMLPEKYGVAVMPGSNYYLTPGHGKQTVRIAYAKKLETLQAARERLPSM